MQTETEGQWYFGRHMTTQLLTNQQCPGNYRLRKFPEPTFSADSMSTREISPCSLHFIDEGRAIVVCYLYHGLVQVPSSFSQRSAGLLMRPQLLGHRIKSNQVDDAICHSHVRFFLDPLLFPC